MGVQGLALQALEAVADTAVDVVPIVGLFVVFQVLVLRKPFLDLRRKATGLAFVVAGLALFLVGLESALFPMGRGIADQLTDPGFLGVAPGAAPDPLDYAWVYVFAAAIGFATTIAEPALITVAIKAEDISGGAIGAVPLRIAVAVGVAVGVAFGAWRIVSGTPLHWFIIAGYLAVAVQTLRAERRVVPLAYDTGGVTTSTVTVPVVSALGLSLAASIPGRDPLLDGFGLIALASLFPIISVLGYSSLASLLRRRRPGAAPKEES